MLTENKEQLAKVKKVLVDGGYSGEAFANQIKLIHEVKVEVGKRSELHQFKVIPFHLSHSLAISYTFTFFQQTLFKGKY